MGRFWRNEIHNNNFFENELYYAYVCLQDIPIESITIQKEEVENIKWIPLEDFKQLVINKQAVQREHVWQTLFEYLEKL